MDCEAVGGVGSAKFVQVGESEGGGLGGEPQALKPSHALVAPSLPLTGKQTLGLQCLTKPQVSHFCERGGSGKQCSGSVTNWPPESGYDT
jgi:hypothetical protein